jgi:hypothetical protein
MVSRLMQLLSGCKTNNSTSLIIPKPSTQQNPKKILFIDHPANLFANGIHHNKIGQKQQ